MRKAIVVISLMLMMVLVATTTMELNASSRLEELKQKEKEQQSKQNAIEKKRKELDKERKEIEGAYDKISSNLEETDQLIQDILGNIKSLELEKAELELQIEELENELEGKQNEIARVRMNLQDTLVDKDEAHEQAQERIRVMYEYGESGFLEVLFESGDLIEMFNRLEYINRLVEADNEIFESLSNYEDEIRSKKAELEVHEATLMDMTNIVEAEKTALQVMVDTKNIEVQNAEDFSRSQKATQEELGMTIEQQLQMEKEMEADIRRINEEISQTLTEIAKENQRISAFDYSGGEMMWPVPGNYRISSKFGPRFHPIHKEWRNHDGMDIPAGAGTTIIAAQEGEVIISKYSAGYGNYIAVAHGNGYVTLYAHCSKRLVEVGDAVAAGQAIGKVGSTGWSTGNHLHFGVKLNNTWVDPMNFVQ